MKVLEGALEPGESPGRGLLRDCENLCSSIQYTSLLVSGDTVNFVYESNHNVEVTSQEAYEACTVTMPDPVPGPIAWTAPMEEGVMTLTKC